MPVIEVQNVSKKYGDRYAVHDVSFAIEKGEIFGLIGPNGAGKTTLVESIAGLRQVDAGQIRVAGLNPRKDRDALRRILGIQLQTSQLPEKIKVWEALDLYSSFYQNPANWEEILTALGLEEKRNTYFEKLSGGQKQRLSIALAMVGNPEILILDELTTGLDPEARRNIWQQIENVRARGVTILLGRSNHHRRPCRPATGCRSSAAPYRARSTVKYCEARPCLQGGNDAILYGRYGSARYSR